MSRFDVCKKVVNSGFKDLIDYEFTKWQKQNPQGNYEEFASVFGKEQLEKQVQKLRNLQENQLKITKLEKQYEAGNKFLKDNGKKPLTKFTFMENNLVHRVIKTDEQNPPLFYQINSATSKIEGEINNRINPILEKHGLSLESFNRDTPEGILRDNNIMYERAILNGAEDVNPTNDIVAKEIAKVLNDISIKETDKFRKAGFDLGELKGYAGRQTHNKFSLYRLSDDPNERFNIWYNRILPRADLERSPFLSDIKLARDVFDLILYDTGSNARFIENLPLASKIALDTFDNTREIHFKSTEDFVAYNNLFGSNQSQIKSTTSQLQNFAKKRVIRDTLGTNPPATIKALMKGSDGIDRINDYFNDIAGRKGVKPENYVSALINSDIRALFAQAIHGAMAYATSGYDKVSRIFNLIKVQGISTKTFINATTIAPVKGTLASIDYYYSSLVKPIVKKNIKNGLTAEERQLASSRGIGMSTINSSLKTDILTEQFTQELLGGNLKWIDKRAKNINKFTNWTKVGFQKLGGIDAMMNKSEIAIYNEFGNAVAQTLEKPFNNIDRLDKELLRRLGVDETTFKVLQQIKTEANPLYNEKIFEPSQVQNLTNEQLMPLIKKEKADLIALAEKRLKDKEIEIRTSEKDIEDATAEKIGIIKEVRKEEVSKREQNIYDLNEQLKKKTDEFVKNKIEKAEKDIMLDEDLKAQQIGIIKQERKKLSETLKKKKEKLSNLIETSKGKIVSKLNQQILESEIKLETVVEGLQKKYEGSFNDKLIKQEIKLLELQEKFKTNKTLELEKSINKQQNVLNDLQKNAKTDVINKTEKIISKKKEDLTILKNTLKEENIQNIKTQLEYVKNELINLDKKNPDVVFAKGYYIPDKELFLRWKKLERLQDNLTTKLQKEETSDQLPYLTNSKFKKYKALEREIASYEKILNNAKDDKIFYNPTVFKNISTLERELSKNKQTLTKAKNGNIFYKEKNFKQIKELERNIAKLTKDLEKAKEGNIFYKATDFKKIKEAERNLNKKTSTLENIKEDKIFYSLGKFKEIKTLEREIAKIENTLKNENYFYNKNDFTKLKQLENKIARGEKELEKIEDGKVYFTQFEFRQLKFIKDKIKNEERLIKKLDGKDLPFMTKENYKKVKQAENKINDFNRKLKKLESDKTKMALKIETKFNEEIFDTVKFELENKLNAVYQEFIAETLGYKNPIINLKSEAGTLTGEILRYALQVKTYPIMFWRNHVASVYHNTALTDGEKIASGVAFVWGNILSAWLVIQIKNSIKGEQPQAVDKDMAIQMAGRGSVFLLGTSIGEFLGKPLIEFILSENKSFAKSKFYKDILSGTFPLPFKVADFGLDVLTKIFGTEKERKNTNLLKSGRGFIPAQNTPIADIILNYTLNKVLATEREIVNRKRRVAKTNRAFSEQPRQTLY